MFMAISSFRVACFVPFFIPCVFPLISSAIFIGVYVNQFNPYFDHYSSFYAAIIIELFTFVLLTIVNIGIIIWVVYRMDDKNVRKMYVKCTKLSIIILMFIPWVFSAAIGFYGLPYIRSDCKAEIESYLPTFLPPTTTTTTTTTTTSSIP